MNFFTGLKVIGCMIVLLVFAAFGHAGAQNFDLLNNRKRVSMPFRIVRNMVIIQLHINNKGPFNFVLDTGVGIMVITDPALLDSLYIANKRIVKLYGIGDDEGFEAYATSLLKITMPGLESSDISAAILKKDHFGLSNYAGMHIHGLLGYDFFNSLAVKFNFSDSTITVSKPGNLRLFRKGTKVPITIEEHKPYLATKIKLPNGRDQEAKLVIDIGAGHPLMLDGLLKQSGMPEKFIAGNLGMGLTGPVTGYISRVAELNIGKFKFHEVITSFPDNDYLAKVPTNSARDGNLGLGILKRFQLIIDYPESAIYLKKGEHFNDPFEHDMSGLEYYQDSSRIIISRVEPGSVSDEVGLSKDDEILSINFKHVQDMSLEQIDAIFRSKDDRSLLLEVARNDKYIKFILTLKRRI